MKLLAVLALLGACGGNDGATTHDAAPPIIPDASPIAPVITSFTGTPATTPIQAGVANNVTWNWTYQSEPTVPEPTCTIDNGVGAVTRGMATSVTLSAVTTFTLTCTNSAGMGQRLLVLSVPPVAPVLASFTVSPTTFAYNTPTNVTFTWTYTNLPSPIPTCTVDGVTPLTSGQAVSLTLQQARTFRLKCTNTQGTSITGSSIADVSVAVTECGTAGAQCDVNANCTDTQTGYVCSCKTGYTGDGDRCTATAATPCQLSEVGDGTTCTRLHRVFTTSTTGTGNLLTGWGVSAANGLAAADAVCAQRATAAGLPGTYVAWMSDSQNDAYCRVHGYSGKKANNCGQAALPVFAGPWVRTGDYRQPFASTIDKLLAPNHQVFYAADLNESGTAISSTSDRVWTATDDNGVWTNNDCNSWTSNSAGFTAAYGEVLGGGTSWTKSSATDASCSGLAHLRCMEVGSGPALPALHPQTTVKRAFITSVSGTGNLSTWPDAFGATGVSAPDAICQARARYAGYPNASAFKAWWTYYPNYISSGRINTTSTPYARPDGVILASNRTDMLDLRLAAPWEQTELNTYVSGNGDAGSAWTGVAQSSTIGQYYTSSSSYSCLNWTNGTSSYFSPIGRFDLLDYRQMHAQVGTCDAMNRFYCVED